VKPTTCRAREWSFAGMRSQMDSQCVLVVERLSAKVAQMCRNANVDSVQMLGSICFVLEVALADGTNSWM